MSELMESLTVWLQQNVDTGARKALTLAQGRQQTGGCHTCGDSEAVLWITYLNEHGTLYNIAERVPYARLIRDLEEIARTPIRKAWLADLVAAIPTLAERSDMIYRVTAEVLRFPGRDGVEKIVHTGAVLDYVPEVSLPWLIKDGLIKVICNSNDGCSCTCEWCRLAALTEDDRYWLKAMGWSNPFDIGVEQ